MSKTPFMQFAANDYLSDGDLHRCKLSTRGFWTDILCHMQLKGRTGRHSGTLEDLATDASCKPKEVVDAIRDLERHKAAVVEADLPTRELMEIAAKSGVGDALVTLMSRENDAWCNISVTLINRRMLREEEKRAKQRDRTNKHRERQRKYREKKEVSRSSNENVTPINYNYNYNKASSDEMPEQQTTKDGHDINDLFSQIWTPYPPHRRRKHFECLSLFMALKPDKKLTNRIENSIKILKTKEDWTKQDGQFVPSFENFLKDKLWETVRVELICQTCNRTGVIVRDGEDIFPWTIEREVNQGMIPDVCPDCKGKDRIHTAGLPKIRFPVKK